MRLLSFLLLAVAAFGQAKINGSRTIEGPTNYCADAGSTDAYACNLSPAITAYQAGTTYRFKANTANTTTATISFNGLSAITIKKAAGGVTTDLATNDIRAGQIVVVEYDGTNMQMQSPSGNAAAGGGDSTSTGAYASASATNDGDVYFPTDSLYLLRDTGAAFAYWGPLQKVVPPANGSFSDLASGTPSNTSATGGALYIDSTVTTGSNAWKGRVKSVPSAPYTVEIGVIPLFRVENYRNVALCLSDGTKLKVLGLQTNNGIFLGIQDWDSVTAINASNSYGIGAHQGPLFFRLEDNNTNWIFSWGPTLNNMEVLATVARNTFLTATHVGVCVNNAIASGRTGGTFFHYREY